MTLVGLLQGEIWDTDWRPKRFIRIAEIKARTTLSTSTIYAKIRAGEFPRGRRIGGMSVAWLESDVDEWMDSQPEADMDDWLTPERKTDLAQKRKAKAAAPKAGRIPLHRHARRRQ